MRGPDKGDTSTENLDGRSRATAIVANVCSHPRSLGLTFAPAQGDAYLSPDLSFSTFPTLALSNESIQNLL